MQVRLSVDDILELEAVLHPTYTQLPAALLALTRSKQVLRSNNNVRPFIQNLDIFFR